MLAQIRNTYIFYLFIILINFAKASDLKITIASNKSEYCKYERIEIHYKIINAGNSCCYVYDVEESLTLTDLNGNVFKYRGPESQPAADYEPMKPGEINEFYLTINDTYYTQYDTLFWGVFFIDPGEYTLQCNYSLGGTGCVFSNEIKISIIEPMGEEKEAYNLFKEFAFGNRAREYTPKKYASCNLLLKKYPNSVYGWNALTWKFEAYRRGDVGNWEDCISTIESIFERYPNQRINLFYSFELSRISIKYKKYEKAYMFLRDTQNETKSKYLSDSIEEALRMSEECLSSWAVKRTIQN